MIPPRTNPFRVDRVSALPFLGADVPALVDDFQRLGRAAIVGPHGAGKSTLLRTLGDALAAAGQPVIRLALPGSATAAERRDVIKKLRTAGDAIVLLDGFEQFGCFDRRRALRQARLLVTAHAPTRLPTLVNLVPTTNTLDAVIDRLLPNIDQALRVFAHTAFERHDGDIRATLFDLYDAAGSGPLSRYSGGGLGRGSAVQQTDLSRRRPPP